MQIIASFESYNARRYSTPWVCRMRPDGSYNFEDKVGIYTGNSYKGTGEAGDLVVFAPEEGAVYGYGQKDNRGNNTQKLFALYTNGQFVPCDKLGRAK